MNGVPEAVGKGLNDIVESDPLYGVVIGILLIALVWVVIEWRKSEKARLDDKDEQLEDAKKDRAMFERLIERLDEKGGRK